MNNQFVGDVKQNLRGTLLENESLSTYNTWRVGGLARYLYLPHDLDDLVKFMSIVAEDEQLLYLGLGSNVLIRDGGFPGIVVITQGCLKKLEQVDEFTIRAEAGVSCAQVARFAARLGLEGSAFLAGVPGTIGGALAMNAGCHGQETWNFVTEVEMLNRQGEIIYKTPKDFEITYRTVKRPSDEWFVAGYFKFNPGNKEKALATIRELLDKRAETQPTGDATCGSVFKNPPGDYSARLIESLGLKGYAIGGAHVSKKHANFFVNEGHSTAQDIENLIFYVASKVKERYGIVLIPEVHVVGMKSDTTQA